jgi:hypothetical protein
MMMNVLQLAWRPGRPTKDGLSCAVVTTGGRVLIGYLGMQLQPFDAAPGGVRAVAWSPEGQQMAFAAGDRVTVLDWASRTSFKAVVPVSPMTHRRAAALKSFQGFKCMFGRKRLLHAALIIG